MSVLYKDAAPFCQKQNALCTRMFCILHENVLYSARETNRFSWEIQTETVSFGVQRHRNGMLIPYVPHQGTLPLNQTAVPIKLPWWEKKLGFIGLSSCISGKTSNLVLMFDWLFMENKDINRLRLAHATQPSLYILDKITAILEIDIWERLNGRNKQ